MVDIQPATAEIWPGKKKKERQQGKNIMPASATQGAITNYRLSIGNMNTDPG